MNNDLYKTLGISRSATAREIKKRYRQLLTTGGESGVTTEQIEAAYQVLSDTLQRTEYDLSLETAHQTTEQSSVESKEEVEEIAAQPRDLSEEKPPSVSIRNSSSSNAMSRRRNKESQRQKIGLVVALLLGLFAAGPVAIVILKVGFSVDILGLWDESNPNPATNTDIALLKNEKEAATKEAATKEAATKEAATKEEADADPVSENQPDDQEKLKKDDQQGGKTEDQRLEVPPEKDVAIAKKQLEELFLADFLEANKLEDRETKRKTIRDLINKLTQSVDLTQPADAYALYDSALAMGLLIYDVELCDSIVDQMSNVFNQSKLEILDKKIRDHQKETKENTPKGNLKDQLIEMADIYGYMHAVAEHHFQFSKALFYIDQEIAIYRSKQINNAVEKLVEELIVRRNLTEIRLQYKNNFENAFRSLKEMKLSAIKASLPMGLYDIVILNDWLSGATKLRQCDDEFYQAAANFELIALKDTATADQQAAAAESWQAFLSEKQGLDDLISEIIINRVTYWYKRALPNLKGISKLAADRWLNEHPD